MAQTERKRPEPGSVQPEEVASDWTALGRHVQDRPGLYIGAIAFVLVVFAATGIYRAMQASTLRTASTDYAAALATEDPAARTAALAAVAKSGSQFAARALYLQGESALDAGDHEGARAAFEELRDRFPGFEFVPDAVEGLGFIDEDTGQFASARKLYEEVASKWPESAAALRQPFNIARSYEGESNLTSAVEQYRKQIEAFPGSTVAVRAQQRLDELRESNPDLFPAEQIVEPAAPVLQELTTEQPLPGQLELSIDPPAEETTPETEPTATAPDPATPETAPAPEPSPPQ
jgi:tetratricopeptide (TPR) repeat protein